MVRRQTLERRALRLAARSQHHRRRRCGADARASPSSISNSGLSAPADIQIELRRGATAVKISWPIAAAVDCAAWMRELLR